MTNIVQNQWILFNLVNYCPILPHVFRYLVFLDLHCFNEDLRSISYCFKVIQVGLGCFMGVILYGVSFMFKEASRCMVVSRVNWRMFPGVLKMVPKTCWILGEVANGDSYLILVFWDLQLFERKLLSFTTIVRLAMF